MGKRGPAAQPTADKVRRGETRPSRVNQAEPRPPVHAGRLDPPEFLDEEQVAVWHRLAPSLEDRKVLTVWDVDAFAAFCVAVSMHRRATKLVNQSSILVVDDKKVARKNPALQVMRDNATLIVQLGGRFGLNPSDRSAILSGDWPGWSAGAGGGGVLD